MNRLLFEKRCKIVQQLVEGSSLRSTARIVDVSLTTVIKFLEEIGVACQEFHNSMVINISAKRIQCDEVWSYVYSKEKNTDNDDKKAGSRGDAWTWIGFDPDTKLVIQWYVGRRDLTACQTFIRSLAARVSNEDVQISTDAAVAYPEPIRVFFKNAQYAQVEKQYGTTWNDKRHRYLGSKKTVILGNPNQEYISTSLLERQNLTLRTNIRRMTRDTNAFSKKFANHCYAQALHFVYYNFVRIHKSLRVPPAMEAGLIKRLMTIEDIVRLVPEGAPQKRGSYKTKGVT